MAEELFWYVYNDLKSSYPAFFTSSRSYPGLPHRIKRTLMAFDSTTIQLTADSLDWAKHRLTVCELYRARWGIEVFFKEIKQTLQFKYFHLYITSVR